MSNKKLLIITAGIVVLIGLLFVYGMISSNKTISSIKSVFKKISNVNYYELSNKINSKSFEKFTDAQKENYIEKYIDKRVQWTGYIEDVDAEGNVEVDMQSPKEYFSSTDIKFAVPKEKVLGLNKDQKITFQGDISYINKQPIGNVDVELNNVEIIDK